MRNLSTNNTIFTTTVPSFKDIIYTTSLYSKLKTPRPNKRETHLPPKIPPLVPPPLLRKNSEKTIYTTLIHRLRMAIHPAILMSTTIAGVYLAHADNRSQTEWKIEYTCVTISSMAESIASGKKKFNQPGRYKRGKKMLRNSKYFQRT